MCLPCFRIQPTTFHPVGIMGGRHWQSLWCKAFPAGFHGCAGPRSVMRGLLCCCVSHILHLDLPLVSFRRLRGSTCWVVSDLQLVRAVTFVSARSERGEQRLRLAKEKGFRCLNVLYSSVGLWAGLWVCCGLALPKW